MTNIEEISVLVSYLGHIIYVRHLQHSRDREMIISIDESGSFAVGCKRMCVFVAVHLRQRKTLRKMKKHQFDTWEGALSKSLKNPKGEIKSNALSDSELTNFVLNVALTQPYIGVTTVAIVPSENPPEIVEKHMEVQRRGIDEGVKLYLNQGKKEIVNYYTDFYHWFKKLSYPLYLKILTLGDCIVHSLSNTIGHSITGKYDDELVRLRFMIDRDFVRSQSHGFFWRELLRNQLWHVSSRDPIPLLDTWVKKGHPFLSKYTKNGLLDLNRLFWENCEFFESKDNFEIRLADAVGTIITRHFNDNSCSTGYNYLKQCFLKNGRISKMVLNDFDLSKWKYRPEDNPLLRKIQGEENFVLPEEENLKQRNFDSRIN